MPDRTRVLITGAGGQLGRALQRSVPVNVQCIALGRAELDVIDTGAIAQALDTHAPHAVINAAAYTAVDKAEADAEAATRLNATAPGLLAEATAQCGIRLLHVSTDFVFDGNSSRPYRPGDATNPLNVYGRTKRAGEQVVLAAQPEALVLRTAWVYGAEGSNFVKTMLRLMAAREELGVVADQIGTPTSADGLAQALWRALERELSGIHHWTDAGVASWYDFAVAIAEEATAIGLLAKIPRIKPIATADYPTPARRPAFSVLDKTATWAALDTTPTHWRVALRDVLCRMHAAGRAA